MCNGLEMKNPSFVYHRPKTVDQTLELLSDLGDEAKVMAGGQSLLPIMAIRLSNPENVIDISRVEGLSGISETESEVTIGALATHNEVDRSDVVSANIPLLSTTMPHIGHRAIRNRGTVCGSLAHADPAAELPAVALALGATMNVASGSDRRSIAAADFFNGFLATALEETELLLSVTFPKAAPRTGVSLQELSRRHGDFALVGIACTISLDERGIVNSAALSFFGVGSTPERAPAAEALLLGATPSPDLFADVAKAVSEELNPGGDGHASANYRSHALGVITKRALSESLNQIEAAA